MSRQQQQEVMWLCSLSTPGWPGCWNSAGTSGDGKNVPQNRTNQPSILLCLCRNSSSSPFVNGTLVRYRRPVLRQLPRAIPFGCFLSFSYFLFESFFFLSSVSCSIDVTMRSLLHIVVIIDFEGFHSRTEVWFEYREAKKKKLCWSLLRRWWNSSLCAVSDGPTRRRRREICSTPPTCPSSSRRNRRIDRFRYTMGISSASSAR